MVLDHSVWILHGIFKHSENRSSMQNGIMNQSISFIKLGPIESTPTEWAHCQSSPSFMYSLTRSKAYLKCYSGDNGYGFINDSSSRGFLSLPYICNGTKKKPEMKIHSIKF